MSSLVALVVKANHIRKSVVWKLGVKLSEYFHSVYVVVSENLRTFYYKAYIKQNIVTHNKIITDEVQKIRQNLTGIGTKSYHFIGYTGYPCNNRGDGKARVTKLLEGVGNLTVSDPYRRKFNNKLAFGVEPRGLEVYYRVIPGE